MAKNIYVCTNCNAEQLKWSGQCGECDEWGTLEERAPGSTPSSANTGKSFSSTIGGKRSDRASIAASGATATPVSQVIQKKETTSRIKTGISEFDRVLGGGLVPGGVAILAGPPGVGKALDINTKILTPEGLKLLEEVRLNETVYAPDGTETKIISETTIFENRPSYNIAVETGETITADENHEWVVSETINGELIHLTTKEMYQMLKEGSAFYIKNSDPIAFPSNNLIAIGSYLNTESPNYLSGECIKLESIMQFSIEKRYELLNHYIQNKDIFTFFDQEKSYYACLDSKLAKRLVTLANTLGMKTEVSYVSSDQELDIMLYSRHTNQIAPSKMNLLPANHPNHFTLVTEITKSTPTNTKCIEVAHESHMFLAGRTLIPTHNSSIGLAVAAQLASSQNKKVLYITGEETDTQVAQRALRTGAAQEGTNLGENLYLLSEQNLQNCLRQAEEMNPDFILVDSLQALLSENSESALGSVTQVTEVATSFSHLAKHKNIPMILIGQVTKENEIAGPRVVEHLVDTVLFFESNSETPLRLLRAMKNRYGSTDEIGCFEHTERGLEEVLDPSGFFTNTHDDQATGYASTIILEGVRALPIEINALSVVSNLANPRRVTTGLEQSRALTIQAILSKYVGMRLDAYDIYIATAGGLKLKDTATDLAVTAALMSSHNSIAIPHSFAFIGEVSLTGEIRSPRDMRRRLAEAGRLGFSKVFCPPLDKKVKDSLKNNDVELVESSTLADFVNQLFS